MERCSSSKGSCTALIQLRPTRKHTLKRSDEGKKAGLKIEALEALLRCYRDGSIREQKNER